MLSERTAERVEIVGTGLPQWWDYVVLGGLCSAWLTVLYSFAYPLPLFTDEFDIILPAISYMVGDLTADVKYPSFSFYFYGVFLWLSGTLGDPEAAIRVARHINYLVFLSTIVLFYVFVRDFFSKGWALVGTFLFTTLPVVAFAAVYVKTEGLLLLQLMVVLVALRRISTGVAGWGCHVAAGIASALAISTKLSLLPLLLYLANAAYLHRAENRLEYRKLALFAATFGAALLVTWTNLWIFGDVLAFWRQDLYFIQAASPFKAVAEGEFFGFPFGTYSSFITTTLPLSLGLVFFFFLGGLAFRMPSPWFWWVYGGATAASLIVALTAVDIRFPHSFTIQMPFFLVAGLGFLVWIASLSGRRMHRAGYLFAILLVMASLAQTAWKTTGLQAMAHGLTQAEETIVALQVGPHESVIMIYPDYFLFSQKRPGALLQWRDTESLVERVAVGQPQYVYVFSSYVFNMCKYRESRTYRENCFFFKQMRNGEINYRLIARHVLPWRGFLTFDPEFRDMSFYLFQRVE